MKRMVTAVVAAAIVSQIWGTFSWMILPWHNLDFRSFSSDTEISDSIRAFQKGSGLYTIPNMDANLHKDPEKMAEWNEKAAHGPFVFMSVRPGGVKPGMGVPMAVGFLLNLIIAGILLWLLKQSQCQTVLQMALFTGIAGAVGSVFPHMSNWNWWHFPLTYCVVGVIDLFITWFLAGLAMGKISSGQN